MPNGYCQTFTLKDIFNNKDLQGVIPLVNYRETEDEFGKTHRTTRMKTVSAIVYETSKRAARPYYKPFTPSKSGDEINLRGNLVQDHGQAFDAVYSALLESAEMIRMTANYGDMIRDALKEAEKLPPGSDLKLYLTKNSVKQIAAMNYRQKRAFLGQIVENIMFDDRYEKTQKKYGVKSLVLDKRYTYDQMKEKWERKVGYR